MRRIDGPSAPFGVGLKIVAGMYGLTVITPQYEYDTKITCFRNSAGGVRSRLMLLFLFDVAHHTGLPGLEED